MTMKLYGTLAEFANKLCKIIIQLYSMKNEIGFMKKVNMYIFGRVSQLHCKVGGSLFPLKHALCEC